ncbi:MAG: penicillin-binding protein 1A [Pseudomonadales bacterium]
MTLSSGLKKVFIRSSLLFFCTGLLTVSGLALYLNPNLPAIETLKNIQLQVPLRIYSADQQLIAEFGEKRRQPISYEQVPPLFIKAILAAEDDRFEQHHGVDIKGLMRAALQLISTGHIQSGGSTITMQVAKNYFLTRERTFSRKFNEILLALQIEQELSKKEILELYVNKIYLGSRAYGIQAAAQVYYGKDINKLSLEQLAMIAGLPKAPSRYNPLVNPERATSRRNWILQRMLKLGSIDQSSYEEAIKQEVSATRHSRKQAVEAPYAAEMVRSELLKHFTNEQIYTSGLRVFTTLRSDLQNSANQAVQDGIIAYDKRHGYRGPTSSSDVSTPELMGKALEVLKVRKTIGPLQPALVSSVQEEFIIAALPSGNQVQVPWEGLSWARKFISVNAMGKNPKTAAQVVNAGDQIYLIETHKNEGVPAWSLAQEPQVQSAFVSLDPKDGALLALVGGFSFHHNKYNRAIQAARQPGSNFKPFVYTAALENGYTAASIINDAPVVFDDDQLENAWRPENYSGKFFGPTRLRTALYKSRNLVSIRLLRAMGISTAINYVQRFGFEKSKLPRDLSLALGSATFTPIEIATGYASFANGGYKVEPYFISRIEDNQGLLLIANTPSTVCPDCKTSTPEAVPEVMPVFQEVIQASTKTPPQGTTEISEILAPQFAKRILPAQQIIEPRAAYIMNTILRDVVQRGTARRARALGRKDLAGKTGTTNDQKDAWFSGYHPKIVATAWVGFDQPQTMGRREAGGFAALPIWISYMRDALKGLPETRFVQPEGLVSVRIDPATGLRASPGTDNAIFEIFRTENTPKQASTHTNLPPVFGEDDGAIPEQLF